MIEQLDAEDYFFRVMLGGFQRHAEQSIAPLSQALEKGDVKTRRNVTTALSQIAALKPDVLGEFETHALAPLTDAISDEDLLVRSQAIEALGRMGPHAGGSLDKIVAALEHPNPPYLPIAGAVKGIGAQPKHLDTLFKHVVAASEDESVEHQRAIWSFGAAKQILTRASQL